MPTQSKRLPGTVPGKTMLFNDLQLQPADLLCLQQNAANRSYDVTFTTGVRMEEAHGLARQQASGVLKSFYVSSMCRNNFRVITVHMYNPWVSEETIRYFLGRYVTVLPGVKEIKDALGIWTGKRPFRVQLKEDTKGLDGSVHPPGHFHHWRKPRLPYVCRTATFLSDWDTL